MNVESGSSPPLLPPKPTTPGSGGLRRVPHTRDALVDLHVAMASEAADALGDEHKASASLRSGYGLMGMGMGVGGGMGMGGYGSGGGGIGYGRSVRQLSLVAESMLLHRMQGSGRSSATPAPLPSPSPQPSPQMPDGAIDGSGDAGSSSSAAVEPPEELSERAVSVIQRVNDKLTGLDFYSPDIRANAQTALDVPEQVERLTQQAMAIENLCLIYVGWCAFW